MSLKILDFAVISRNIVDLGRPQQSWNEENLTQSLSDIIVAPEEWFQVINDVSNRVCSLARKSSIRFQLPSIEILDQPRLHCMSDDKIIERFKKK